MCTGDLNCTHKKMTVRSELGDKHKLYAIFGNMPGKCTFNEWWLENTLYKLWLERNIDKCRTKYKVCMKTFDVSNMGKSALVSHERKEAQGTCGKARKKFNYWYKEPITKQFFCHISVTYWTPRSTPSMSSDRASASAGMSALVTRNDTLTAEIWWPLKVISIHYSCKSCEDIWFNVFFSMLFHVC